MFKNTVITGSGSYIPKQAIKNESFLDKTFYTEAGVLIDEPGQKTIDKFKQITDIEERRYAANNETSSSLGTYAAELAIADAGIDPETLDYIIVAQNFGDVEKAGIQSDMVPSIAARIKKNLEIKNPRCVAYDVIFGCPGWIEGMIQAHLFIKAGAAKKCLVIGSETLSRVVDKYDRDSMIFADGAGATVVEVLEEEQPRGILSHASLSFAYESADFLYVGKSNLPDADENVKYIKMKGRKIYEYALVNVAPAMKECMENASFEINNLSKILIHQANHKMDEAIIKRFYKLYNMAIPSESVMPMTIDKLGNSSVATIPTLYDLIMKGKLDGHSLEKGNEILLASVGAGMNINAIAYKL